LMSLNTAELAGVPFNITGNALFSGIYLNELLVRLLPRFDAYPAVFQAYHKTLIALQDHLTYEHTLRLFEKALLIELGYGFALDKETHSGQPIQAEHYYEFIPNRGLNRCTLHDGGDSVFCGKSLLAMHREILEEADDLRAAKRLNRIAINALLGNKKLRSREFF